MVPCFNAASLSSTFTWRRHINLKFTFSLFLIFIPSQVWKCSRPATFHACIAGAVFSRHPLAQAHSLLHQSKALHSLRFLLSHKQQQCSFLSIKATGKSALSLAWIIEYTMCGTLTLHIMLWTSPAVYLPICASHTCCDRGCQTCESAQLSLMRHETARDPIYKIGASTPKACWFLHHSKECVYTMFISIVVLRMFSPSLGTYHLTADRCFCLLWSPQASSHSYHRKWEPNKLAIKAHNLSNQLASPCYTSWPDSADLWWTASAVKQVSKQFLCEFGISVTCIYCILLDFLNGTCERVALALIQFQTLFVPHEGIYLTYSPNFAFGLWWVAWSHL